MNENWTDQRAATYVGLAVVLDHGVDYFPPPLDCASNGVDDLNVEYQERPFKLVGQYIKKNL